MPALPFSVTITGAIVLRGRLPGSAEFTYFLGPKPKLERLSLRRMPVPGATTAAPQWRLRDCVAQTMLPDLSMTMKWVVSALSGVGSSGTAFGGGEAASRTVLARSARFSLAKTLAIRSGWSGVSPKLEATIG